jgi:hypothetical protein
MNASVDGAKPCAFGLSASTEKLTQRAAEATKDADEPAVDAAASSVHAELKAKDAFGGEACTGLRRVCTVEFAVHADATSACTITSSLLLFASAA